MAVGFIGKKVLVTGATGLIGRQVTRRLLREGAQVRGLARDPAKASSLAAEGAEIALGDMADAASLRRAVEDCQMVFHFAGLLSRDYIPSSYYRVIHVEGTRLLAEAALEAGIERFVHASTFLVYGLDAGPNTDESSPRLPSDDPYCDTKLAGENVVRELVAERGLPAVIVQPCEIYGPGDETWTLLPIRMLRAGRMILPRGGTGLLQPIYIDDVVEGVMAAARTGKVGEAYLLCGSEVVTVRQFFGYYARMVGRLRSPSVPGWVALLVANLSESWARLTGRPAFATRTAARGLMMRATYDGSKARRQLRFTPSTNLETGMRLVEQWLHREGIVPPEGQPEAGE